MHENEMRTSPITKGEIERLIQNWGKGTINEEDLQAWCEKNYFPLNLEIGPDEPAHIQKAMNVILNEFELSDPESFNSEGFAYAVEFLATSESNFERTQQEFLKNCFQ